MYSQIINMPNESLYKNNYKYIKKAIFTFPYYIDIDYKVPYKSSFLVKDTSLNKRLFIKFSYFESIARKRHLIRGFFMK